MKKIVIATKNKGKIKEMTNAFQGLDVVLIPLSGFGDLPDPVENGRTFAENARIKAAFYMKHTGCACLADDSGLEVEALGNAPGIYSARFAGYHADDRTNNEKLLAELAHAGRTESPAAYRCVLVFMDKDGTELLAEGRCGGIIRSTACGTGGFGYDPYFYVGDKTIAELTLKEKNKISHRGAALRKMSQELKEYLHENRNHE
jgi:XTP/dITP diphosphohydrolase